MDLNSIKIEVLVIAIAILAVILLSLCILVICLLSKIKKLTKKYEQFMTGENAETLEAVIMKSIKGQSDNNTEIEKINSLLKEIDDRLKLTIQKVALVKYDAFQNMGGELSYSIALLDDNNDGIVITNVYSPEGSYNYSKEIKNSKADIILTEEEQKAINIAIK